MGAVTGDGLRRSLKGLPTRPRRLVVGLVVLLGYGLFYVGVVLAFAWLDGHSPDWTEPLGGMVGPTLGAGLGLWIRRRRMGSIARVREFDRAVRTRQLPDDADPAVWAPLLARERRALRRARAIVFPVAGLVFTAAAVMSAAVLGVGWSVVLAIVATGMLLIIVGWLFSRRNAARIDYLSDQLSRN